MLDVADGCFGEEGFFVVACHQFMDDAGVSIRLFIHMRQGKLFVFNSKLLQERLYKLIGS